MNAYLISQVAEEAACKGASHSLFYPETGGQSNTALRICQYCPVQQLCLKYALSANEYYGVWGGHSERSRRRIQRRIDNGQLTLEEASKCQIRTFK